MGPIIMLCALVMSGCGSKQNDDSGSLSQAKESMSHEGYTLEQVVA